MQSCFTPKGVDVVIYRKITYALDFSPRNPTSRYLLRVCGKNIRCLMYKVVYCGTICSKKMETTKLIISRGLKNKY